MTMFKYAATANDQSDQKKSQEDLPLQVNNLQNPGFKGQSNWLGMRKILTPVTLKRNAYSIPTTNYPGTFEAGGISSHR